MGFYRLSSNGSFLREASQVDAINGGNPSIAAAEQRDGEREANDNSSEISIRLDQAVKISGGPSAVARGAGMYLGTLNRYRMGREMPVSALISLARATGVCLEWLATGSGPMLTTEQSPGVTQAGVNGLGTPQGYLSLPMVEVPGATGPEDRQTSTPKIDFVLFSEFFLTQTLRRKPKNLALLIAAGDSMARTIQDGDLLLVDTSIRQIQASRIYVLRGGSALMVKRIQVKIDGSLVARPDNPIYEPEVLAPDQAKTLHIVGEVVWHAGPAATR